MTGWLRISESFGPTIRATRSLPPPAPNPTISRIGLLGKLAASSWAEAWPESAATVQNANDANQMEAKRFDRIGGSILSLRARHVVLSAAKRMSNAAVRSSAPIHFGRDAL